MFAKLLVANDGSPGAIKALAVAIALAQRCGAALHMVSVEELPRFPASIDEVDEVAAEEDHRFAPVVAAARAQAQAAGIALDTHLTLGHPVEAIVTLIGEQEFDLLVVGFMGHSALYQRIIGGTTDRLVDLAPCTVLVVK
jgi:nucleotide-binding universal stress UspA family protein